MRDFSHLTPEQHEEMRQNDTTGEHGRWEDDGQEHDREVGAMTETPRTWTLTEWGLYQHDLNDETAMLNRMPDDRLIEVVEKAPVDIERERLLDLLEEIASSGVAFEDDRLRYLDVQIDRDTWEKLKRIYEEAADV